MEMKLHRIQSPRHKYYAVANLEGPGVTLIRRQDDLALAAEDASVERFDIEPFSDF